MNWVEIAENPKVVTSLYSAVPSLEGVMLREVVLDPDGPTIRLRFDLHEMPQPVPRRWQEQHANQAQLEISVVGIYDFKMEGWGTDNVVTFSIAEGSMHKWHANVVGDTCRIAFSFDFLHIDRVSGYCSELR